MSGGVLARSDAQRVAAAMPRPSDYAASSSALLQRRGEILASLRDKGRHVLVMCDSVESQRRCARDLEGGVASSLRVPAENFVAESAEAVIEHFNRLLSVCDFSSARAPSGQVTLRRVVTVPDIRALTTPAGLLLVRLVASFPGAGVRLLVLAEKSSSSYCERVLDSLARSLDIIDLDGSAGLSAALRPRSGLVDPKPFNDTQLTLEAEARERAPTRRDPKAAAPGLTKRIGSGEQRFDALDFSNEPELHLSPSYRSRWRQTLGWLAAFASLLLVSALVVVLLHRERTPAGKFKQEDSVRTLVAPATGRDSSVPGRGR